MDGAAACLDALWLAARCCAPAGGQEHMRPDARGCNGWAPGLRAARLALPFALSRRGLQPRSSRAGATLRPARTRRGGSMKSMKFSPPAMRNIWSAAALRVASSDW